MDEKNLSEIKKLIREQLENLSEDFRYLYDRNGFTPPVEVINTCKKALEVINHNNLVQSDGSNEGSGLNKAKSLVGGQPINHSQLKRMKAYFDNNIDSVRNEKVSGKNINNSGILQSWDLWGGDDGKSWVDRQINSTQSNNQTSKEVRRGNGGGLTKNIMNPHNTRIHK